MVVRAKEEKMQVFMLHCSYDDFFTKNKHYVVKMKINKIKIILAASDIG